MNIRIDESGTFIGWTTPEDQHELTHDETLEFADQIEALKEGVAKQIDMPYRVKAIVKALVKTVNLRLPADKKITAAELKQAIKEEL